MVCTTQTTLPIRTRIVQEPSLLSLALALVRALDAAQNDTEAISILAQQAERFPGIVAVDFAPDQKPSHCFLNGSAIAAPVRANGNAWGVLRSRCSSGHARNQVVTEFLANQLALTLNKLQTNAANAALKQSVQDLNFEIHTRKVLHRARGVVARWYGISEQAAEVRIRTLGERSGRTVAEISNAVIEAEELPVTEATARAGIGE